MKHAVLKEGHTSFFLLLLLFFFIKLLYLMSTTLIPIIRSQPFKNTIVSSLTFCSLLVYRVRICCELKSAAE